MEQPLERFGHNVRKARHERDFTQEDLAFESGLSVVQISRIERGRREIRLSTLLRLVDALKVKPNDLLEGLYGVSPKQYAREEPRLFPGPEADDPHSGRR